MLLLVLLTDSIFGLVVRPMKDKNKINLGPRCSAGKKGIVILAKAIKSLYGSIQYKYKTSRQRVTLRDFLEIERPFLLLEVGCK